MQVLAGKAFSIIAGIIFLAAPFAILRILDEITEWSPSGLRRGRRLLRAVQWASLIGALVILIFNLVGYGFPRDFIYANAMGGFSVGLSFCDRRLRDEQEFIGD